MDRRILQKWTEYSDEVSKRMSPTEEREDVAPLVAAILTLAEEIFSASRAPRASEKRRPRAEAATAQARGESRGA